MAGKKLFRATAVVTLVIIVSKALGFLRESIIANYFGAGMESDAYFSAYSLFYLPILLLNSCITSTIVPLSMEIRQRKGLIKENRFAVNALNFFFVVALLASAALYILAKPLVSVIYYGFDAEKIALTVRLTRIMSLTMCFNVGSIVLSSLLNAREQYVAAQLTGFPLSFAMILASIFFSRTMGIFALAWGVFFASILQTIVLIPFLGNKFHYKFRLNFRDPMLKRMIAMSLPAMLSMAVSELNHMIDRMLCSGLNTGDMSCMNYAYKLITFLTGIVIVPLTVVLFSRMSAMVAKQDKKGIMQIIRSGMVTITLIMLPIVIVGAVLSPDVIRMAYARGGFNADNITVTAGVLTCYILGVIGFGLRDLLNRAFHSMQDTKTPMLAACIAVGMNVVLNLILRAVMGVNGLALATTISGSAAVIVLLMQLKKRMRFLGFRKMLPDICKILLSAVACLAVTLLLNAVLPAADSFLSAVMRLCIGTAAAFLVYFGLCFVLRVKTLRSLIKE